MEIVVVVLAFINLILFYLLFNKNKKNSGNKSKLKRKARICPLCGSLLLKSDDCVIGEYIEIDGKKKVYIYGCNYCYKGKTHRRVQL